jgi:hypothetical protein
VRHPRAYTHVEGDEGIGGRGSDCKDGWDHARGGSNGPDKHTARAALAPRHALAAGPAPALPVAHATGAFDVAASTLGLVGASGERGRQRHHWFTCVGRVAHGRRAKGDRHMPGAGGRAGVRADPRVVNMFHLLLFCSLQIC